MFNLVLKNFRKFHSSEFQFDQQFCLISGKSGKGKTTIFMAILFALTGEGKKLVSHGQTSCSVTLSIQNIKITRTKRPNRLLLETNNTTKEDKEAQQTINNLFLQYGYMSQRIDNKCFILMSPVDKMKFIEKMIFGEEDEIKLITEKCKNIIKTRKTDLMLTTQESETIKKILHDLQIEKIIDEIEYIKKENVTEYDNAIQNIESQINNCKTKLNKIEILIKLKQKIESELIHLPDTNVDEKILEDQIKQIYIHNQKWDQFQAANIKLSKLSKPTERVSKSEIQDLKQIIELEKETFNISSLRLSLTSIQQQIDERIVYFKCPSCEVHLSLCNEHLFTIENDEDNKLHVSYEEMEKLNYQKTKIKCNINLLQEKVVMLNKLKDKYPTILDAKTRLKNLIEKKQHDEDYMKQKTICDSLVIDPPRHNMIYLDSLKLKLKQYHTRQEKIKQLQDIKIEYSQEQLSNQLNQYIISLQELKRSKKIFQSKHFWDKLEELESKKNNLETSYPRSIKLYEILKEAEKITITKVIDEINLHAQIYLDHLLDDITISLSFDDTKLNVNVKQNQYDSDLLNLSGGELARVVLAFTIAIAEVNNINLLLLDECVSSLDQDSATFVIDVIKQNFRGTVICIAHQITKGLFDQVIELD